MSTDIVVVFIFCAGPIRGHSPGGRLNNFYSHGRRGNSHFENAHSQNSYSDIELLKGEKMPETCDKINFRA